MSDSRFISRGAMINMGGNLARSIVSLLNVLLPRVFSQATFGMFLTLQSFVYTASTLVGLGLSQGMVWWIPRLKAENRFSSGTVWNGLWWVLAFSSFIVICTGLSFVLFHSVLPKTLQEIPVIFFIICIAAIPAHVALLYACGCLLGIRRPEYSALYAQFLAISLVTIIALLLSLTQLPNALAWSLLGATWLCAGIVIYHLHRHFPPESRNRLQSVEKPLLVYSLPIAFYNTALNALGRIDLWIVFAMLGAAHAAQYGIMLMLAGGIIPVSTSYSRLIVPVVSGMDRNAIRSKLKEVFSYTIEMVAIIQFAIAFFMFLFPKELLSIAGTQYSIDTTPFLILIMRFLISGYTGPAAQVILGMGKSRILLWTDLAILAFASLMNYLLIPEFGLRGAALSMLTAIIVQGSIYITLQTRIAGQWMFSLRVMLNFVWMAMVILCVFIMQPQIASLSFIQRIPLLLTATLFYALWLWHNRRRLRPRQ